jgi:hypothetical protein
MTEPTKFATTQIYYTILGYKEMLKLDPSNKTISEAKKRISKLLRGYEELKGAEYISEEALKICKVENPYGINYSGRKKTGCYYEHSTPIRILRDYLLNNDLTAEEVSQYMAENSTVTWITPEENDKLNAAGYNNKRPGGWRKCYEELGIKIVQK